MEEEIALCSMLTFVLIDNILVTENGYENLTPTPKEVDEMRKIITGQA